MRDRGTPLFPVLDLVSSGDNVTCDMVPSNSPSSSPHQESGSAPHMAHSEEASSTHEELHIPKSIPANADDEPTAKHIAELTTDHNLRRSSRVGRQPMWLQDYVTSSNNKSCQYPLSSYAHTIILHPPATRHSQCTLLILNLIHLHKQSRILNG